MGAMKQYAINNYKMPSIEENVIIEMVTSHPLLAALDQELEVESCRKYMDYREFSILVERRIGGYFHDKLRDQLDWDYVALHWWKEREVPQFPEDDYNYNRSM
jgi:hypothetical protein